MRTQAECFDELCTLFGQFIACGCALEDEIELFDEICNEWYIQGFDKN